jgi:hypothetical protein
MIKIWEMEKLKLALLISPMYKSCSLTIRHDYLILCLDVFLVTGGTWMYTSAILIALTGSLVASTGNESLNWRNDYMEARKIGQSEKKPLAVFIGNGASGYEKVCRDGKISAEVEKMLEDSYVCVYVDSSTPEGQQVASAFGNTKGLGLVLSDRTGELKAFSHEGDLSAVDLGQWVKRFADPSVVVSTTMTNASTRLSAYTPSNSFGNYAGNVIYGSQGYFSSGVIYGGGCPGGNCGGGGIIRRR